VIAVWSLHASSARRRAAAQAGRARPRDKGRPSVPAGRKYEQRALSRDAYADAIPARKTYSDNRYASGRKRDSKEQGGWQVDFRKNQGDRRSRWV